MSRNGLFGRVFLLSLFLALGACGKKSETKGPGQVAAKVNGDEVSIHQVNYVLQRLGTVPETKVNETSKQVLEKLIDEQLLVQKAVEQKLDRDPRVVQAIEATKRQILSQAYMEQVMAAAPKRNAAEIQDFYAKRPELFGERRLYRLYQATFAATPELLPRLEEQVKKAKTIKEVTTWLTQEKIAFNVATSTKAAEQLPADLLPHLHKMKDGSLEIVANSDKTSYLVLQLAGSQTTPVDAKAAEPFIDQYLQNQKRAELASAEVKHLRSQAKIEYVAQFAKVAQESKQPSPAATKSAADNAGQETKKKESAKEGSNSDHVTKGLSDINK
jgi:EpsD family peptidyl-prolyl cis-trans isomerase